MTMVRGGLMWGCCPSSDLLTSAPVQDTGTAKKLAFSREVNSRCITLEGDDFNPLGLLTGAGAATPWTVL